LSLTSRATLVLFLLATAGCFSSPSRRRIVGGYCLEQWPRGFSVVGCSAQAKLHGTTDNGPMDGNVLSIGWDDRFIVARRRSVYGGTVAWMILDTKLEILEGPFTDEEFSDKLRGAPAIAAIKPEDASAAWARLR
jgi:hypothetical protein